MTSRRTVHSFMTKHQYVTLAVETATVRWAALARRASGKINDVLVFDSEAEFTLASAEADTAAAELHDQWAAKIIAKNNG